MDDPELAALFRRIFEGGVNVPLEGLRVLTETRTTLDRVEALLVAEARFGGATWSAVGAELGISRQAARLRHRPERKRTDGV